MTAFAHSVTPTHTLSYSASILDLPIHLTMSWRSGSLRSGTSVLPSLSSSLAAKRNFGAILARSRSSERPTNIRLLMRRVWQCLGRLVPWTTSNARGRREREFVRYSSVQLGRLSLLDPKNLLAQVDFSQSKKSSNLRQNRSHCRRRKPLMKLPSPPGRLN